MKWFKKRYLFPIAVIGAALVGGSLVYAFTSQSFSSKAAAWVNSKCTQNLINSKNTDTNDEKATICYNYFKNGEQDASIANDESNISNLQNSVSSLSSNEDPLLLDGNNTILGPLVNDQPPAFYSQSLNRIVWFSGGNDTIGNSPTTGGSSDVSILFSTSNCSGTPYLGSGGIDSAMSLLVAGQGYYYVSNTNVSTQVSIDSRLDLQAGQGGCDQNLNEGDQGVVPVSQVSIPYNYSISQPIHLEP